ncbi:PRY family cell wall 2 [Hyphodiscus hymeniophilus]|uniref:PRY family cell wall 2 n=1 Tax=Hyphodiscus hymeniophilus TaxID=353542 RepID=A0A9P7AYS2_9HELO|nr:PRY family cell wall 2 [Hyphodiscus hymeniophilus]
MQLHLLPTSLALLAVSHRALASPAVSTITRTATSPPVPTSTSFTSDSAFETAMLAAHNFYRKEHNASALTWNSTSAKYAASWAGNCVFKHSGGPTGENLAAGYTNASQGVDAWGLERESYDWAKPGFSEATGHFTQVVWRNTTSVGCGRTACEGRDDTPGFYVVCEYYPPGNVVGDGNRFFVDNVWRQVEGRDTDTVESGVTSFARGWGS